MGNLFCCWNFLVLKRKRQRHGWLTKDSQSKNSQKHDYPWALNSHACVWPWSLSEWWNNTTVLFYVLWEFFVVLAFFLPIEEWKEHVHLYEPKRKLAMFFRFCLIWGLGQDEVNLLNRKVNLLFPEGGETVIAKVQFQLQLMVIYRMESQNCLHLFSKVIFVQSRKLRCFFCCCCSASICLCLLFLFA